MYTTDAVRFQRAAMHYRNPHLQLPERIIPERTLGCTVAEYLASEDGKAGLDLLEASHTRISITGNEQLGEVTLTYEGFVFSDRNQPERVISVEEAVKRTFGIDPLRFSMEGSIVAEIIIELYRITDGKNC